MKPVSTALRRPSTGNHYIPADVLGKETNPGNDCSKREIRCFGLLVATFAISSAEAESIVRPFSLELSLNCSVEGLAFRVQGRESRVEGSRSRVQGSGFRVHGPWFRVQDSGFRVGTG